MSKPNIYGFCDAGCKWKVPHKDDVGAINLGVLTVNPINVNHSVLNSITESGIYSFIWNTLPYLMYVTPGATSDEMVQTTYSITVDGTAIVFTRCKQRKIGESGFNIVVSDIKTLATINDVSSYVTEILKPKEVTKATENGLYSVEIVKSGATLPSHSVLMYVELGKGTTVMSQLKVDGTWYAVEVECWGSGTFNLRVDAAIKGVFELGNVRLVKIY